jgi:predicted aldo/keto reductase-like oxidoreductase
MKKLGFGFMRLPLLDAGNSASIDQEQVNKMADLFIENGFNYVDTAYIYHNGQSEVALRKAFVERYPRDAFYVADKMPLGPHITSSEYYMPIFAEQIERMGGLEKIKYFDNYLLHGMDGTTYPIVEKTGGFDFMKKIKAEGNIKHICISWHDTASLLDTVLSAHPEIEYVQLQINYTDWASEVIQSGKCYDVCVKHGKPVIVMEPVKGGSLANLPPKAEVLFKTYTPDASNASWAIRYAASLENVCVVLSGMSCYEQIADNVSYMKDFQPLTMYEKGLIAKAVEEVNKAAAIPCTGCRYCLEYEKGCPENIPIPEVFSLYNSMKQYGYIWHHFEYYQNLCRDRGNPVDCIDCGHCEQHCPQHIEIRKWLKESHKILSDLSGVIK